MMDLKFSGYLESSDSDLVNKMKTKVAAGGGGGSAGEQWSPLWFENYDGI